MFKLSKDGTVLRLADNASIPNDPNNLDRVAYQEWLREGNTPQPADAVVPVEPPPTIMDLLAVLETKGIITKGEVKRKVPPLTNE